MLSVNPISFNQKNKQSNPSFKMKHTLTHQDTHVISTALSDLDTLILSLEQTFGNYFSHGRVEPNKVFVKCPDDYDQLFSSLFKKLANKFQMSYVKPQSESFTTVEAAVIKNMFSPLED